MNSENVRRLSVDLQMVQEVPAGSLGNRLKQDPHSWRASPDPQWVLQSDCECLWKYCKSWAPRRTWELLIAALNLGFGSQSEARDQLCSGECFFCQSEKLHKVGTSSVCQNCGIKSASVSSDTALEIYGTDLVMGRSTSVVDFFFFKTDVCDVTGSEAKHIEKQSLILFFFSSLFINLCYVST